MRKFTRLCGWDSPFSNSVEEVIEQNGGKLRRRILGIAPGSVEAADDRFAHTRSFQWVIRRDQSFSQRGQLGPLELITKADNARLCFRGEASDLVDDLRYGHAAKLKRSTEVIKASVSLRTIPFASGRKFAC